MNTAAITEPALPSHLFDLFLMAAVLLSLLALAIGLAVQALRDAIRRSRSMFPQPEVRSATPRPNRSMVAPATRVPAGADLRSPQLVARASAHDERHEDSRPVVPPELARLSTLLQRQAP